MAALVGDVVVSAISVAIAGGFSSTEIAKIYKNKAVQNMIKPCAFIHQINMVHTPELKERGNRDYLIDIRVHPLDTTLDVDSWARALSEKMIGIIEKITVEGQQVKARPIECRVEDEVLHIIVKYAFKIRASLTDVPEMETIEEYIGRVI